MHIAAATPVLVPRPISYPGGASCRLCAVALPTGEMCGSCVGALLGLGLDEDEALPPASPHPTTAARSPELSTHSYEHFAICLRTDGTLWELGRGAMGITYRAFDTHLLRPVALKVINGMLLGDPEARGRFMREARAAARLRHPHIATILHLGQATDDGFYVMEYIEGESLAAAFASHPDGLPLTAILEIVTQVARALAAAHAENLVHRDIKPANIMLARHATPGSDLHVKVIDFGLAKLAAEENPSWCDWYFAGTPHYASPEQLVGRPVDARADLYSLGVVFWRALAGEAAFLRQTARGAVEAAKLPLSPLPHPPPAWLETLPPTVGSLLVAMLASDPARRPRSAVEVLARCQQCVHALPEGGGGTGLSRVESARTAQAAGKPARRRTLAAAFAACLLLAGAVLFWLVQTGAVDPFHWTSRSRRNEAKALFERAQPYLAVGDAKHNDTQISLLEKAVGLDPDAAEAHAALAWAYTQRSNLFGGSPRDRDLALANAERAVALAPLSANAYYALGLTKIYRGSQWEALEATHRAIELDPHHPRALATFGLQWVMLGAPEKGLPWLVASAKLSPRVSFLSASIDAYIDLCADEEAEQCAARCVQMAPAYLVAYRQIAHLHLLQGDYARAKQDLLNGAAVDEHNYGLQTLNAQLALYTGHFAEAEKIYRRLHESGYQVPISFYGSMDYPSILCFLAYRDGRKQEGDAYLKEALGLYTETPDGPQATYDLAAVRCLEGRPEEGLTLLRRSVAAGWLDYRSTLIDPRFETLRGQAAFAALIEEIRAKVTRLRQEAFARLQTPLNIADYPVTVSP